MGWGSAEVVGGGGVRGIKKYENLRLIQVIRKSFKDCVTCVEYDRFFGYLQRPLELHIIKRLYGRLNANEESAKITTEVAVLCFALFITLSHIAPENTEGRHKNNVRIKCFELKIRTRQQYQHTVPLPLVR